jgi:predicted NACHT family NTPase
MTKLIETGAETLTKKAGEDLYVYVKAWFKKIDIKGTKCLNYVKALQPICDSIQIMGMSKPRRLTGIYVALRAYPELRKYINQNPDRNELISLHDGSNITNQAYDVESAIRALGYSSLTRDGRSTDIDTLEEINLFQRDPKKAKTLQGIDVFNYVNANSKIAVLGQPGSGKTTFLKTLALLYGGLYKLSGKTQVDAKIPIYVRLRDYSSSVDVLAEADWFQKVVFDSVNSLASEDISIWIIDQLKMGNCLVLVDGLDEVPKSILQNVILSFRKFSNKYSENKYVTSCRTSSYNFGLEGFRFCEVDDFNSADIKTFVTQWFEDHDLSKKLIKDMHSNRHSTDLMRTPLLATLVCIMYEQNRTLPNNRSELYDSCIDALIYKWDSHRQINRNNKVSEITAKQTKYLLAEVSRKGFEQNRILIHKNDLLEYFNIEINKMGLDIDPNKLLNDFENNMGILIERSPDVYCFSHLTFQEYFAAISYAENRNEVSLAEKAFNDPRYKEVFLLTLERMYLSDEPIIKFCGMIKNSHIRCGSSNPYLENLLIEIFHSQANFKGVTRKLIQAVHGDLLAIVDDD